MNFELTVNNFNSSYGYPYQFKQLPSAKYGITLYLNSDGTNCKLSYIHGAGVLYGITDEEKKAVIDRMLLDAKGTIVINTTCKEVSQFIEKTYLTYYSHELPIGYHGGYQYHLCIKNTINTNAYCKDPVKDTVSSDLSKEMVKIKL